ncbi:Phosphotransferase enzyme family protein [Actinopolymorpha cephalotaxi]|uniref:Phosphotransferase enzyme family protein n=1 Tax=Actinopolymorpha cephalotaxi TaxID=504797 RepID=A0A1I3AWP7_9ACTN|nr:aminoglycoside phosphotransferase family protein [Actinopolymorpha cephalotaxi]NYH84319.1 Ser/Thr protein kinase RdoA (MazF antagonist) [Actinopolymorpha cephalotaxi]SFH54454.1 Phosphotransferase enzyme family protein [Actinopolymorpha cephalotaxi]
MTDTPAAIDLSYVEAVLGPCTVVREHSWPHRGATVLEIGDASGRRWFAKRHQRREQYDRELSAYLRWVPALRPNAPELHAYDDERRTLVLSAVPGRVVPDHTPGLHRLGGTLLRRLHDAEEFTPDPDYAAAKEAELEEWLARSDGLLDPAETAFARSEIRCLQGLPSPPTVPCHRDYSPRNWLLDGRNLYAIDFEWARPDAWVADLGKLFFGPWQGRPDLRDAFLEGYGHMLTGDDLGHLVHGHALTVTWQLIWSTQHGNLSFAAGTREVLHGLMQRAYS